MAGRREGGIQAAKTNMKRYGRDYYKRIGSLGGKKSTGGGFASMDIEKLREISSRGGKTPKKIKVGGKKDDVRQDDSMQ